MNDAFGVDSSGRPLHAEFRKRVIVEELLHLRIPTHGMVKTMLTVYLRRRVAAGED